MLSTLKRLSLVFIIILSLAFFGYLVYTGMGAKTKASVSTNVAGNGEIPISTDGLVAQWNFNETNGDIARSEGSCGKLCDGQLVNFAYNGSQDAALGTGWTAKNKLWGTGSLMFDGVNDYINLGSNSPFRQSSAITYEFWTNIPLGGGGWIMGAGGKGGQGYGGVQVTTSSINFTWTPTTPESDTWIQSSAVSINPDQWTHIAVVVDFGNATRAMYLNGKPITTKMSSIPSNWTPAASYSSGQIDAIGSRFINNWNYYKGSIDAVRIYSRALSEKEIAANFQAQNEKKIISPPADSSVVGLWHLDETSGNAFDSSGNGNTGVSGIITTAGKLGSAALNPNIIIKDSPTINLTNKLTMEYWFQPTVDVTSMSTYPMGVFKRNWEVGGYGSHFWNKDGTVNFQWCWVGACDTIPSKTSFKAGIWYHYAATYDGVNARLFINGVEENSKAVGSALASSLGYNLNIGDGQFQGKIDEVRIYSRALSEKEIAANFAAMNGVNVRCGDTQCDPGYICRQAQQPVCPEGVNCSTVLPQPECVNPSIFQEKLCGKEVCKPGYECYQPPRQSDIPCEIGKPCQAVDQLPPSCRPITTPTPIFTPQTSTLISDNFDGVSLDTNKWNTWKNPSGTQAVSMNQEGGVVRIKINPNQTVYSDGVIERKEVITGDFEASVDLKIEQTEGKNTADTFLFFHSVPWGNIIVLGLRRDATNTRMIANQYFNNNWKTELNNPIQPTDKVTVILKKVKNSIIYNYRLNNGEIKTLGTQDAAFNGNGSFLLIGNSFDQFPSMTTTFDNFSAKVNLVSDLPTATPIPQSLTATPVPSGTPNASGFLFKVRMPDVSQAVGTVKDVRVLITDKPGTLYDFKIDLQRVQGTDFFIANPIELDIPDGSYLVSIKHAKTLSRTFTVRLSKGKTLDCSKKDADTSCESLGRPELAPLYAGDSDGLVDTKTNNGVRANSYNVVDSADLQRVVAGYGLSPLPPEPNGDFNLDGKIDVQDLGILGKNFGKRGD